jgi:hypothetical protein
MIDWCLTPTWEVFQLYRGMKLNKGTVLNTVQDIDLHVYILTQ